MLGTVLERAKEPTVEEQRQDAQRTFAEEAKMLGLTPEQALEKIKQKQTDANPIWDDLKHLAVLLAA